MKPLALAAALALLPALAVLPARAAPAAPVEPAPRPDRRTIRVSGAGRVLVRPDVAVVHVGVEAAGKDLARTVADAAARTRRVLDALAKAGVPERDVRTTRHDVSVERAYVEGRPAEITGYTVSDEVRVVVRDLSRLGPVLERVVAAGSNALRGLAYEKDDPAPERREALARAVADARADAEAIARAGGVALGELLEVVEATPGPVVPFQRGVVAMGLGAAEGAPVSPGELEVHAAVEVVWAVR